jgi:hypothetical protein
MKQNKQAESNLKDIFKVEPIENESGNLESVKASKTEIVKASNGENEKLVNLGVKIPAAHRNFWNGKAAAAGVSMKSVIIDSLTEKFGKPE